MSKFFRASIYVTAINLLGLGLNFFLNLVLASKFGVGKEMDCFLAATATPTYLVTILTGSLSVTFIPAFIDKKNAENKWELMGSILMLLTLVGAVVSVVIFLFSFQVIDFQAPGFPSDMRSYSSTLLRWYVVVLFLTMINEVFSGIFYATNEFVIPMVNKLISPIITISLIYAAGDQANAFVMVWSSSVGALIQTIILIYNFYKSGYRVQLGTRFFSPGVRSVLKLMTPLLIGSVFYKSLPIFDKYFLSELPPGSISVINYAQKIFFAAIQILGAALSMQVLAHMSHLVSESNYAELKKILNTLVRLILFVTIPVAGISFLLGEEITRLIYERGKFNAVNTLEVVVNFRIYVLAIPAALLGTVVAQGLYVMKDTWSPFFVGIFEVTLYGVLCYVLVDSIGILALPLAYVIYFYFSLGVLGFLLFRKIEFIRWKEIALLAIKYGSLMAVELLTMRYLIGNYILSNVETIGVFGIAFTFYLGVSYFLKFEEALFLSEKLGVDKVLRYFGKTNS
jgi:putative peptidoglycan lipid II flippase